MLWVPDAKALVVKDALPLERVAVPKTVAPSRKATVPVGVPADEERTTANVTGLVRIMGFALLLKTMAAVIFPTAN